MKILMINPTYTKDFVKSARWAAKSRGRVQRHPDRMCMATAILEQDGHDCRFIDAQALNMSFEDVKKQLKDFKPELTGIWATTPSIYSDIEWGERIKQWSGSKIFLLGAHPSALPKKTLEISKKIDGICIGEFDYTLRDLTNGIGYKNCLGIAYRKGKNIIVNKRRPPINDLDSLPFPAWHHIDPRWYHDHGKKYPFITLIGGRGCWNACTFCRERFTISRGPWRRMSANRILDEIEHDFELFPFLKEIMIEDDTFVSGLNKDYIQEFLKEKKKRKMDFTWSCNTRADLTDKKILENMKEQGCRMLCVGYEFGNQGMLDRVAKRVTLNQMRKFTSLTREVGLRVNGCFMIGGPGETKQTALETIKFAKELNPNTVQFSVIVPYPGTPFYEWCKKNDYIIAKDWTDWVDENFEQATVISYPQLSKEEMEGFVNQGLREFYLRPSKVLELLLDTRSISDIKRFWHGFKSFIDSVIKK